MSGFLLSLRLLPAAVLERAGAALSYVPGARAEIVGEGDVVGVTVRSDDAGRWGSARDPATGVVVWLGGRTSPEPAAWDRAPGLPYEGGLAARLVLDAYLAAPDTFARPQNGAFALVVWDPRDATLRVATDRMGFFPVYTWDGPGGALVATHPDVLARAAPSTSLDLVTMAEALVWGQGMPPYTYHREVRELEPGAVHLWARDGTRQSRPYWTPRYAAAPAPNPGALADDLAAAITAAVRRRTRPELGPAALLLSGGADSRAILYGATDPARVTSVTLYTDPNAELATAQALAARVGSPHVALRRSFEYYGDGAPEAVRIAGGMWNVLDGHYAGVLPEIDALGAETVLTGCYADYLFKGLTSNRRRRTLFGRAIPLYEFGPHSDAWYVARGRVGEAWQGLVRERHTAYFEGTDPRDTSEEGRWAHELRRIRPVIREADATSRLLLQRALRWDPIFADTDLLEVYQRIPPSLKLNGHVWERAVAQICHQAGDVRNNNTQSRIGVSDTRKLLAFLYGVAYRKVRGRDLDGTSLDGGATRGSWPDFDHYLAHSEVVPELWRPLRPETREVLTDLLGTDPYEAPMIDVVGQHGAHAFMRLLTVKLWLDQWAGGEAQA